MGSNQDFATASRIELSKCECESNQKTANCKSICELRPKKEVIFGHFCHVAKSFRKKKNDLRKISRFFCFVFLFLR